MGEAAAEKAGHHRVGAAVKRLQRLAVALLEPAGIGLIVAGIWRYDEAAALIVGGLAVAVYGNLLRR